MKTADSKKDGPCVDRDPHEGAMNRFILGLVVGLLCCGIGASTSAQDAESFNLLKLAGNNVHWQAPANDQPLVVT